MVDVVSLRVLRAALVGRPEQRQHETLACQIEPRSANDVEIRVKRTRKPHGEMSVVVAA